MLGVRVEWLRLIRVESVVPAADGEQDCDHNGDDGTGNADRGDGKTSLQRFTGRAKEGCGRLWHGGSDSIARPTAGVILRYCASNQPTYTLRTKRSSRVSHDGESRFPVNEG